MLSIAIISFIILLTIILGIIVFTNDYKNKTNRIFLMLIFWIVFWQVSNFLQNEVHNQFVAKFLLRMDFMGAMLAGYSWLIFSFSFPVVIKLRKFIGWIILSLAVIFAGLSYTDLIINNIHFVGGVIRFDSGVLWIIYSIILFGFFICGYINLIIQLIKLRGIQRIQAFYVFLGFTVSSLIALVINLFFYDVVTLEQSRIGLYGIILFIVFTSYAIIKHHLMDIKVIATEIFSMLLVLIALFDIFLSTSAVEVVVRIVIFAVTLFFAILLIRSVLREIKRREEMEVLAKELKKATKKLESANKELKRLDDAKSEFLSIASHQLRTPLTIIKGYSSMMLEGSFGKLTKVIRGNVEKIFISTERLISLVESLLNISRIESGRLEFNIQSVDLAATTEAIVVDFQQKAKAKNITLEFHKEGDVANVATDPQKVKEVISNIIDNSVKYTPIGGIIVSLHLESQSVVFACQDTGIGIEPEDLPRLFNKFVRGKGMMQVYTEGTGLGMYFARMVVENMGGRIWAESPGKNKGSKFSFSLPLADKTKAKKIS